MVLWNRLAEIAAEYLEKGSRVYIEGRLQTRSWDHKQTGQKKYTTEVVANELVLLGNGKRPGNGKQKPVAGSREASAVGEESSATAEGTSRHGNAAPKAAQPLHRTGAFVNAHGVEVSDQDIPF